MKMSRHDNRKKSPSFPTPVLACVTFGIIVFIVDCLVRALHDSREKRKRAAATIIVLDELSQTFPNLDWTCDERPAKKRRHIRYDRERARQSVWDDYLSPTAYFNDKQFQRMLRVSPGVFETLRAVVRKHQFFSPANPTDATGRRNGIPDPHVP